MLGLTGRHFDALAAADDAVKQLVATRPLETTQLVEFQQTQPQKFDIFAFNPLIDEISRRIEGLAKKYSLNPVSPIAFLMSEVDALETVKMFEFLKFLAENCINYSVVSQIFYCLPLCPHLFALAKNTTVAIAASNFGVSFLDEETGRKSEKYTETAGFMVCALNSHKGEGYLSHLSRTSGDLDLLVRIQQVKLLISYDVYLDKQGGVLLEPARPRNYCQILDPQFLDTYPHFLEQAINILVRPIDLESKRYQNSALRVAQTIQENDLFLYALQRLDATLLAAIVKFYSKLPKRIVVGKYTDNELHLQTCLLSDSASSLIISQLETINRQHTDLNAQEQILNAISASLSKGSTRVEGESPLAVVQRFGAMLHQQLQYDTPQDTRIAHGILKIILHEISKVQDSLVTLASDNLTLATLFNATQFPLLQAAAIKSLVCILSSDLICFTYAQHFWSEVDIEDPLALGMLYVCLCANDRGLKVIEENNLSNKLLASVFDYGSQGHAYSSLYYSTICDAITSSPKLIEEFAKQVPQHLEKTYNYLETNQESYLDIRGRVFRRFSKNEKVVDHCVWLLSTLVHRDLIRIVILRNIDLVLRIISHRHLPYAYPELVQNDEHLQTLINELTFGGNKLAVIEMILNSLDSALKSRHLERIACTMIACLQGISFLDDSMDVVHSIIDNKHLKSICESLPGVIVRLLSEEVQYFADHQAIVECFWAGFDVGVYSDANSVEMQFAEAQAFQKLGISFEEYEVIKGGAKRIRTCKKVIEEFGEQLCEFFRASNCRDSQYAHKMSQHLALSYIQCLSQLSVVTVQDRYVLAAFIATVNKELLVDYHLFECGLLSVAIHHYYALCTLTCEEAASTISRYTFRHSSYVEDCKQQLNCLLQQCKDFWNDEGDSKHLVGPTPHKSAMAMYEAIGEQFKVLKSGQLNVWPQFRDFHLNRDFDLSDVLWIQGYLMENYLEILEGQDLDSTLICTRLMALILVRMDRQNPVLDKFLPQLYKGRGLALLAGLMDAGHTSEAPQLDLYDPQTVAFSAQVLRRHPPKLENITELICIHEDPLVLLMLLELATACLLHDTVHLSPGQVDTITKHCLRVFTLNGFSYHCSLCIASFGSFITAALEQDEAILDLTMLDLISKGDMCLSAGDELKFNCLLTRDSLAVQRVFERYFVIDPPTQELYWRHYVSKANLASPVRSVPLQESTRTILESMISQYIENADEFLQLAIDSSKAESGAKAKFQSGLSLVDGVWGCRELDELNESRSLKWNVLRQMYFKVWMFTIALTRVTAPYSSSVADLVVAANPQLIEATIKCASAVGLFREGGYLYYEDQSKLAVIAPIINILQRSDQKTTRKVLHLIEKALSAGSRDTAFGVMVILYQISDFEDVPTFINALQDSQVLELCEELLDAPGDEIFDLKCLYSLLVKDLDVLCEVKVEETEEEEEEIREGEPETQPNTVELIDLLRNYEEAITDPSRDEISESVGDSSQLGLESEDGSGPQNEGSPLNISTNDFYNSSSEHHLNFGVSDGSEGSAALENFFEDSENHEFGSGSDSGYSDEEEEEEEEEEYNGSLDYNLPYEAVVSRFDTTSYEVFMARNIYHCDFWSFNVPQQIEGDDEEEAKTLEHEWEDLRGRKDTPIYHWSEKSTRELAQRGLDLGFVVLPSDSKYHPWCVWDCYSLITWPSYLDRCDLYNTKDDKSDTQLLTRTWNFMTSAKNGIDWSKLEAINLGPIRGEAAKPQVEEAPLSSLNAESILCATIAQLYPQSSSMESQSPPASCRDEVDKIYHILNPKCQYNWSNGFKFVYLCDLSPYIAYPSHLLPLTLRNKLLDFFVDNISSFSGRIVGSLLDYFDGLEEVNSLELLKILDSPFILMDKNFVSMLQCVSKHVKSSTDNAHLDSHTIIKLVDCLHNKSLLLSSREKLIDLIKLMLSRQVITSQQLQAQVYEDLIYQLDHCLNEANSLSTLESTLLILSKDGLIDLSDENEEIIIKTKRLGCKLSESLNPRLFKCYALLAGILPSVWPAFLDFIRANQVFSGNIFSKDRALLRKCLKIFEGQFDLLNFTTKVNLVHSYPHKRTGSTTAIMVRRDHIVEDTLVKLEHESLDGAIVVEFENELGHDDGGLTREWLTLLGRELPSSHLFVKQESNRAHPRCDSNLQHFELVGRLMAKAALLRNQFDFRASHIVFKAIVLGDLVCAPLSMEDVEQFDPELAASLQWILKNDITGTIDETFSVEGKRLLPGGLNMAVNETNKQEYVYLRTQHIYRAVLYQIRSICKGFHSLLPLDLIRIFTWQELELLVCGNPQIDVQDWKYNTVYRNYTAESSTIKYFWQAMSSVSNETRKRVLMFATGSDSVSSLGFSTNSTGGGTKFIIDKQTAGKLPTASTCSSTLHLPAYKSYDELRIEFFKAIEMASEGFGLV